MIEKKRKKCREREKNREKKKNIKRKINKLLYYLWVEGMRVKGKGG